MRWIVGIVLLWTGLAHADPVFQSQVYACTKSAKYDASTNGATKLVTGTSTAQIYVCGFTIVSGGTVNVSLEYGSGTNCGTGATGITPAFNTIAGTVLVDHPTWYAGITPVPASKDLCILASAGVAVQAIIYYSQF